MTESPAENNHSQPVVLVVEDEWILLAELAAELERSGWRVVEATSGEDALLQVQSGTPIDLLITDIRLAGGLNGWDVAEAVRGAKPEIPVIYVSGNTVDESRTVPGSVFLSKPCRTRAIEETGRALLGIA